MRNNKCLGIDGLPANFFQIFWKGLKFFVLRALNFAYRKGEMSISLRTCIVNCIPKGNKPREYLQNWRPISLLSVPYKIASLALANRLKTVLDCLISKTQSGFIKGRFNGDSTRLIYDLIHLIEMERKSTQLVLIDFEKAFDSVSWNFYFQH